MKEQSQRILLVITSTDFGGAETGIRELCLRLHRNDFEPHLCSLTKPGRMAVSVSSAGVPVHTLGMSVRPRVWDTLTGSVRLSRLLDRLEVDLIHSSLYRANVLASIACRLSRRRPRLVSVQHSLTPPQNSSLARIAARWTRRLSDRVVAVSQPVQAVLQTSEKLPADRVALIQNGIDTMRFRQSDSRKAREIFGLDESELVLAAVGRLAAVKGFDLLLRALAALRDRGVVFRLLLAGEGPEKGLLQGLTRELHLCEHVLFLGLQEEIESVYAACDIFVLSSLREGSPSVLLEAMASGCAIVATKVGGIADMVEEGSSAVLVEAGSPDEMRAALRRLSADSALRRRLGLAARDRASDLFDISRMVRDYEELYRSLLRK